MVQVWKTDATYIRESGDVDKDDLVINYDINSFLNTEKDTKYFIVATKGLGKTLFLRYKRILYQEKHLNEINFVPSNELVDKVMVNVNFNTEQVNLFDDEEIWKEVWMLAIILSSLKAIMPVDYKKCKNPELYELFHAIDELKIVSKKLKKNKSTPYDYLGDILRLGFKEFFEIKNELADLIPIIRGKNIHVLIFLDNIDEIFVKHLKKKDVVNRSSGVLFYRLWYHSQIGLMKAVRDMSNLNHHIKVFASIRKEAYLQLKTTDEMALDFRGNVLDLNYTKEDLKQMFVNNIKRTESRYLAYPDKVSENPILSFTGFESVEHDYEDEDLFSYIFRHTLKRPRDLMSMGGALSALHVKNMQDTKKTITAVAVDIAKQYLSEVSPHIDLSKNDFFKLFTLIDKKIISESEMRIICSKFNSQKSCDNKDCKICDNVHVFCNLYKIGLIGFIETTEKKNNIQQFLQPGDATFDSPGCLPKSSFYFIHPILHSFISNIPRATEDMSSEMIIGDGCSVDLDYISKLYRLNDEKKSKTLATKIYFFICSQHILTISTDKDKPIIDIIDKLKCKFESDVYNLSINVWYTKDFESESIFHKVSKKIRDSNVVIAEISDLNPNVMYESGFAGSHGKELVFFKNKGWILKNECFNLSYTSYKNHDEFESLLNDYFEENHIIKSKTTSDIFNDINSSKLVTPQTNEVYVLSFDDESEIVKNLKQHGFFVIPRKMLDNIYINPSELAKTLLDAKSVLINLKGKQKALNSHTISDSKLMFIAGICYGHGINVRIFQDNKNFYSDVLKISEYVVESSPLISYVNNLPIV